MTGGTATAVTGGTAAGLVMAVAGCALTARRRGTGWTGVAFEELVIIAGAGADGEGVAIDGIMGREAAEVGVAAGVFFLCNVFGSVSTSAFRLLCAFSTSSVSFIPTKKKGLKEQRLGSADAVAVYRQTIMKLRQQPKERDQEME